MEGINLVCPRCGESFQDGTEAISRRDDKTAICSECGTSEGLFDYQLAKMSAEDKRRAYASECMMWKKPITYSDHYELRKNYEIKKYDNETPEIQEALRKLDTAIYAVNKCRDDLTRLLREQRVSINMLIDENTRLTAENCRLLQFTNAKNNIKEVCEVIDTAPTGKAKARYLSRGN